MSSQRWMLTVLLLLALLAPGAAASPDQPAASRAVPASPSAPDSMLIVENAGQWPEAARFQVWNSPLGAGTTWLANDAIWLVVTSDDKVIGNPGGTRWQGDWEPSRRDRVTEGNPAVILSPPHLVTLSSQIALKLTFPGSNPQVRIEPLDPLTTTISYFLGNDPAQWHPAVPVYGGVRYSGLYPGVDLEIHGGPRHWVWRLVPAPEETRGTSSVPRLRIEGAESATMVASDVLRLTTATGDLDLSLPASSVAMEVEAVDRVGHSSIFMVRPGNPRPAPIQAGDSLAPADDPADLIFSTYLGGGGMDDALALVVDDAGYIIVAGYTGSSNFPTTPGVFDPSFNNSNIGGDAFISRVSRDGSALVYSTFLGGRHNEKASAIDVDGEGRVTVAGYTGSSDFPTTSGAYDTSFNGGEDAFVTRLSADGSALVYSTFLGGAGDYSFPGDAAYAIAVDSAGRVTVAGSSCSSDFPTTPGAFDTSYNGGYYGDAFITRLSADGGALVFSTFLGGSDDDGAFAIAMDGSGRATLAGDTQSVDFPTTPGAFDHSYNGIAGHAFIARLSADGSALVYSTFLGGDSNAHAIAVDSAGRATVAGETWSINFPTTPGAFDRTSNGGDAFVTRLSADGRALVYSTFLGGDSNFDYAFAIAVDGAGRATVAGQAWSSDFPTTPGAFDTSGNSGDAFVTRLTTDGSALVYSTFLGGTRFEQARTLSVDDAGRVTVAGSTDSDNFPTTAGAFDLSYNDGQDAFVSKLDPEPYTPNVVAPIEQPSAGAFVSGVITLRGFAIDLDSPSGTGIDMVHIYLDGPYGTGTIIGGATYGLDRPDVAAQYGERFRPSGWELAWGTSGLAPGVHRLYLFAHLTIDNAWSLMDPHLVVVAGGHTLWLPVVIRSQ